MAVGGAGSVELVLELLGGWVVPSSMVSVVSGVETWVEVAVGVADDEAEDEVGRMRHLFSFLDERFLLFWSVRGTATPDFGLGLAARWTSRARAR